MRLIKAIMLLFLSGCTSTTFLDVTHLSFPPVLNRATDRITCDRWALLPLPRETRVQAKIDPLVEKKVLFFTKNWMESYGWIEDVKRSCGAIFVLFSTEYKEINIPPTIENVPVYVPERRVYTSGTIGGTSFAATTRVPAHVETRTEVIPGRTKGYFFHSFVVVGLEKKGSGMVPAFRVISVGTSENPDIRVGGQWVLAKALDNIMSSFGKGSDSIFKIMTIDGEDYYPFVVNAKGDLKYGDLIAEIDSFPTKNIEYSDFKNRIAHCGTMTVIRKSKKEGILVKCGSYEEQ